MGSSPIFSFSMRASAIFLLFALCAIAFAQTVDRFSVDDFTRGSDVSNSQQVTFTATTALTESDPVQTAFNSRVYDNCVSGIDAALLGCAREMYIDVYLSNAGRDFVSAILPFSNLDFEGSWDISTPKGGNADYWLQYDGGNGSRDVDINGLGGLDLTDEESAFYSVGIYSPNGGICEGAVDIDVIIGTDYTRDDIANDIDFSEFTGDCDFTNVGAVDVLVPSVDGVDAVITQITGIGLPDPSASQTPAPSPTRTPEPSASRTPSPSGPCVRFCTCPSFTCAILYDNPYSFNDFDLGFRTSQEILDDSDEEIVYVPVPVTVTVPTVTVPTVTVPTVTVPTVTIPTVTVPTVTIPSVTVP